MASESTSISIKGKSILQGDTDSADTNSVPTESPLNPSEFQGGDQTQENCNKSNLFNVHMKKVEKPDGTKIAVCNYCAQEFKWSNSRGYGTYRRHINSKHPAEAARYANATPNTQFFQYNEANHIELLTRMVAVEQLPLDFGEKISFVNYCKEALNPAACPVSRNTLARSLFDLYKEEKKSLIKYFKSYVGRVSLCVDIWSDHWKEFSYMGVTCHYIDNDWTIQKRVLAFRNFGYGDILDAENIYKMLKIVVEEYKIEFKIFAIGFDNTSNYTMLVPSLRNLCNPLLGGKFFHQRCVCNVIKSCAQSGLVSLQNFISPIRDAVYYLWKHSSAMKAWMKFCTMNGKHPIRFSRDIPTRWDSAYKLLCQTNEYKELLCSFFRYNLSNIVLHPQQWDICTKICHLLKVFHDASNNFSSIYRPATHLFVIESINIVGAFEEFAQDEELLPCIDVMKAKWLEHYHNIPTIYLIALVFDPHCKLHNLGEFLSAYYNCLNLKVDVPALCGEIKEVLFSLYEEYCRIYGPSLDIEQSDQTQSQIASSRIGKGYQLVMKTTRRLRDSSSSNSELANYLTTCFDLVDDDDDDDCNFNIIQWWKDHERHFPVLAIIAKQVLSMPVAAVAVEQESNVDENVLDKRRSCLRPDLVQAQVCLGDWTRAQYRQQELKCEFFEDDQTTDAEGSDSN